MRGTKIYQKGRRAQVTSPVEKRSCCKNVHMLPRVQLTTLSFKGTPAGYSRTELRKVLFTFEHNDQLCKQMWLLLEKKRHNWAPEMAPQSELQFGTPNCVSLYFRRRKPKSGARFGARTRTAFWDPFPAGKLRRQQSSLFRVFLWINVQESQHALKCEILA